MDNEKENKEIEFDPSESEAFYENLDAALGLDNDSLEAEPELPEISLDDEISGIKIGVEEAPSMNEDDLFAGVDAALSEQIAQEFGSDSVPETGAGLEKEPKNNKFAAVFRQIPTWTKVLVSVILVILLSVGLLFGTKPGRSLISHVVVDTLFKDVNVVPDDPTPTPGEPTPGADITGEPTPGIITEPTPGGNTENQGNPDNQNPEVTNTPTLTPVPTIAISTNKIMQDEDVVNILLLGEENMAGAVRGRTDAILVASLNKNTGKIKLVSFLRDSYVQIPGKQDDRLNAAYTYGGAKLMMETIEKNFRIKLDGYVLINFSGFENMIDDLGGLRISLTARESEYLNTTPKKYISKPEERNTIAGYQNMTGSQVLGYCRLRYVPTENGLQNDVGRAYRHRVVLKALFDKYKEKGLVELLSVMKQCFSYVTTSESVRELAPDCLQIVVEKHNFDFDTLQIPKAGHHSDVTIAGKAVLSVFPDNADILQEFLYEGEME